MTCDTKRHWICSVVCRSSARFIMPVEIMNRESKENQENYSLCYEEYRKKLQAEGVRFLENESCDILLGNQHIYISGLELPLIVNKKFRKADVPLKMYADAWEKSIYKEIRKNSRRQQRISQTTVITFCLPTIHPIWKLIRNGVPI